MLRCVYDPPPPGAQHQFRYRCSDLRQRCRWHQALPLMFLGPAFSLPLSSVSQACYGVLHCSVASTKKSSSNSKSPEEAELEDTTTARETAELTVPPGGRSYDEYDAIVVSDCDGKRTLVLLRGLRVR